MNTWSVGLALFISQAPIRVTANTWKSESEVAQSCPTLCDPMDCSLPGSSVHGISSQSHSWHLVSTYSTCQRSPKRWTHGLLIRLHKTLDISMAVILFAVGNRGTEGEESVQGHTAGGWQEPGFESKPPGFRDPIINCFALLTSQNEVRSHLRSPFNGFF